jgi:hypothetical protein
MNRLFATGAVLGVLLGTTGLAFAQDVNSNPYYSGGNPTYGQPMPPPSAAAPGSYAPQSWPTITEPHSAGTAGRAFPGGQKTN